MSKRKTKKIIAVPTNEMLGALDLIKGGADIYDYSLARTLRQIEKEFPLLIEIGKSQMYFGDGSDKVPYFGAIVSPKGRKFLSDCKRVVRR